jgi:hypothetical protein
VEVTGGELIIARLWRWDAERLQMDADRDHAEQLAAGEVDPDYSISVFGLQVDEGMTAEEAMRALCERIVPHRSANWVTFTTEQRLSEEGFKIRLREPPPAHYDVILGTDLDVADVARLAGIFNEHQRRRFPSCTL